jgi:hypothetical protein
LYSNAKVTAPTGIAYKEHLHQGWTSWASLERLSDDGARVIIGVKERHGQRTPGYQMKFEEWDLRTGKTASTDSEIREALCAEKADPHRITYNRDHERDLKWSDPKTGQQIGQVPGESHFAVIDHGRKLLTCQATHTDSDCVAGAEVSVWDISDGTKISNWKPPDTEEIWGDTDWRYGRIVGADDGDLIVAEPGNKPLVLLWDVAEQTERARLYHQSSVLSRNGRWFASIDLEGVVRVWQASDVAGSVEEPWRAGAWIIAFGCSATITICVLACAVYAPRLFRRRDGSRESNLG